LLHHPTTQHPIQVLVVDDDTTFSSAVACDLRAAGLPTIATTFFDALDIVEATAEPIDILLADVNLDRGNGVALCRLARLRRPGLRTIYVTGYDLPSDVTMCAAIEQALSNDVSARSSGGAFATSRMRRARS
jgi:CheY-like chemotaxis protein